MGWFDQLVAIAMNAVNQGNWAAVGALFFVAALTEVGVPFPFVIDAVLFFASYQNGLWSVQVLRVILVLILGREAGAAIIFWLSRFLGPAFINWLRKRVPKLCHGMDWLNTKLSGRRAPLAVAVARLTPGLLTPSTVAAGCIKMRYYHLVLGIVIASVIADGVLVVAGFATQHGLRLLGLTPSVWQLVLALGFVFLIVWLVRWLRSRHRSKGSKMA